MDMPGIRLRVVRSTRLSLVLILASVLYGCIVPDNHYLMELNRNGRWQEVERIGLDMLRNRRTFSHSELCETYFHVIYAKTRMDKSAEAISMLEEYERFSVRETIDPELRWLNRELAKLKEELGLLNEGQRLLVMAMEENGKGNYAEARELTTKVLMMGGLSEVQEASAHFVAAVCSVRLGDALNAEHHHARYVRLKSSLPRNHPALQDEQFLVRGLEELRSLSPQGSDPGQ